MKTFVIKVSVDDTVDYEEVEMYLDNNTNIQDIDLLETYED